MVVNKSRSNHSAVGVNGAGGGLVELPDSHNFAVGHRHVGVESGFTGAVDHSAILDE